MPTTRPHLIITETDEVAEALDIAAVRWPETKSRPELLLKLVIEGRHAVERRQREATALRRVAIRQTSGALTGTFEPGDLHRLRDDWPA